MDPQRTGRTFEAISPPVLLMYIIIIIRLARSGGIKGGGGMGDFAPPWRLCPSLAPRQKEKMVKISNFWQSFGFLPPQKRILPPRCPPTKNSGAATASSHGGGEHLYMKSI